MTTTKVRTTTSASPSSTTKPEMSKQQWQHHKITINGTVAKTNKIIVYTFVLGALAFVVSSAWNLFFIEFINYLDKNFTQLKSNPDDSASDDKKNVLHNAEQKKTGEPWRVLVYNLTYALIMTLIAVIVVYVIVFYTDRSVEEQQQQQMIDKRMSPPGVSK